MSNLARDSSVWVTNQRRVGSRNTLSKRKSFEKRQFMDLPSDLVEEVFSRVPITSLRRVRLTCKNCNTLCKNLAPRVREFMVVRMVNYRLSLMSVDLENNNVESFLKRHGRLISLEDSDQVDVSNVFQCDGLLLCVLKDTTRLVVWNPYLGCTRWIEATPRRSHERLEYYRYAFGYTESRNHKILRFVDCYNPAFHEFLIYDLNSDSWKVLDVTIDWHLPCFNYVGLTLKGNTYWVALENYSKEKQGETTKSFLVCFDFTRESFGSRLHLPFEWYHERSVTLSNVRDDEQLAVLFQPRERKVMEIWVTNKIEPNAISWNTKMFLEVDTRPFIDSPFLLTVLGASVFIDQEKIIVVVLSKDKDSMHLLSRHVAYIFGVDGSLKKVDLEEPTYGFCFPFVCSYVPSLVQLN